MNNSQSFYKYKFLKINLIIKRLFDFISSLFGFIFLLPFLCLVAIAIKLDSKGSVIFCQNRLTKNGKVFSMYKFRTMFTDSEHSGSGLFSFKDDPRITAVGRFLRNTSIDELPQLFNVIKGDLSLVGPRPPTTYSLGDFQTLNKRFRKRFEMLGGITGLAQVKGRNENSWDEKVTFDNQYIDEFKQLGVFLDIKILAETFLKVFAKKDIYEQKADSSLSDEEAAKIAREETIRLAHLPD